MVPTTRSSTKSEDGNPGKVRRQERRVAPTGRPGGGYSDLDRQVSPYDGTQGAYWLDTGHGISSGHYGDPPSILAGASNNFPLPWSDTGVTPYTSRMTGQQFDFSPTSFPQGASFSNHVPYAEPSTYGDTVSVNRLQRGYSPDENIPDWNAVVDAGIGQQEEMEGRLESPKYYETAEADPTMVFDAAAHYASSASPPTGKRKKKGAENSRVNARAKELFQCTLCDSKNKESGGFGSANDRERHWREVHRIDKDGTPVEGFPCLIPGCNRHGKPFPRRANLEDHQRKRHRSNAPDVQGSTLADTSSASGSRANFGTIAGESTPEYPKSLTPHEQEDQELRGYHSVVWGLCVIKASIQAKLGSIDSKVCEIKENYQTLEAKRRKKENKTGLEQKHIDKRKKEIRARMDDARTMLTALDGSRREVIDRMEEIDVQITCFGGQLRRKREDFAREGDPEARTLH